MRRIMALPRCLLIVICVLPVVPAAPQDKTRPDCKSRISHTGFAEFIVPKEGGTHRLAIKAGASVKWTVQNSGFVDWITILEGSSGTGPGSVTIQLEANPGNSCRVGELAIGGIVPVHGLPIRILQEGTGAVSEKKPATSSFPNIVVLEPFPSDPSRTPGVRPYKQLPRKP